MTTENQQPPYDEIPTFSMPDDMNQLAEAWFTKAALNPPEPLPQEEFPGDTPEAIERDFQQLNEEIRRHREAWVLWANSVKEKK